MDKKDIKKNKKKDIIKKDTRKKNKLINNDVKINFL